MTPPVRRAIGLVLLGLVIATTCTFLGRWQWHRHVGRSAQIRVVEQNYAAEPVPLGQVLSSDSELDPTDAWRPVVVTGHYEAGATVLLRNRPVDSQAAYHVLVPLVVDDPAGTVLLVDRGWVPMGTDGVEVHDVPAPPQGTVTVTARLRPAERASTRTAPPGQVQSVAIDQVLAAGGMGSGVGAYRAYGSLVTETPAAAATPGALPVPSTDAGNHLSYAFQWWTFAAGSLVSLSVVARRELRDASGRPVAPRAPRVRRTPSREEEEDALLEAQGS